VSLQGLQSKGPKPIVECDAWIFDLDGVLVDSSAVIVRHWALWAAGQAAQARQQGGHP